MIKLEACSMETTMTIRSQIISSLFLLVALAPAVRAAQRLAGLSAATYPRQRPPLYPRQQGSALLRRAGALNPIPDAPTREQHDTKQTKPEQQRRVESNSR